jgi:integrase
MTAKLNFTEAWIKGLKPSGKRQEFFDTHTKGMGLRLNTRGQKTFFLMARFPGSKHPTRRTLFEYSSNNPDCGLSDARVMALLWKKGARHGIDVRARDAADEEARNALDREKEEKKDAEKLVARNTYEYVVRRYLAEGTRHMKAGSLMRFKTTLEGRAMRKWRKKHILEIKRADVKEILEELKNEGKIGQGFNAFAHLRAFFNWAISVDAEDEEFGITANPCHGVKVGKYLGAEAPMRDYDMPPDEIRAVWRAAGNMAYPIGPYIKLLFLSMQRRSEVADAVWSEFDFEKRIWTIPAERMKNKKTHVVPLPPQAWSIIEQLPRFKSEYLFSSGRDKRGSYTWERAKKKLAKLALVEMQLIYKERGLDPAAASVGFRLHDLRRAGRSALSILEIPSDVSERVISHTPGKLIQVYDKHDHLNQKRRALEAWADYLIELAESKPSNIVRLRA